MDTFTLKKNDRPLASVVAELADQLRNVDPETLAAHTAARYFSMGKSAGMFTLPVWGRTVALTFPDLDALDTYAKDPVPLSTRALVLQYLASSDGLPETGRWISFSELPDGKFYNRAFQGYTGDKLASIFKDNHAAFGEACVKAGGRPEEFASVAYRFRALPRVSVLAACWQGDEDFRTSFQILFDAAASHHLPTDVCAIVGSTLTRQLEQAFRSKTA